MTHEYSYDRRAVAGVGTQERIRDIAVAAEYGGIECQGESKEMMDCQAIPCPVDGEWGARSPRIHPRKSMIGGGGTCARGDA